MEKKLIKGEWRTRLNANEVKALSRAEDILDQLSQIESSATEAAKQLESLIGRISTDGVLTNA